jgi:hypothetical protein
MYPIEKNKVELLYLLRLFLEQKKKTTNDIILLLTTFLLFSLGREFWDTVYNLSYNFCHNDRKSPFLNNTKTSKNWLLDLNGVRDFLQVYSYYAGQKILAVIVCQFKIVICIKAAKSYFDEPREKLSSRTRQSRGRQRIS